MIRSWYYPTFRNFFYQKQEINLKIGIVAWDLNISGGTQRQALELAINLQRMGHNIKVYTIYYDKERCYPDLLDKLDIKYLYSDKRNDLDRKSNNLFKKIFVKVFPYWIPLLKTEKLYDNLTGLIDEDLDLLCCHDYGVYPVGAKYKIETGTPVVWQMNDLPIYKANFDNLKGIIKSLLSPLRGEIFLRLKHTKYIKKIDKIVVMDILNKNKLKDNLGLESTIVRNGLDIEKFKFNERKFLGNKLKIMSNGIFFPLRRLEDLIEALKIVKDKGIKFELNHVGTDVRCKWYAEKIYKMVKKFGLSDCVVFHGHTSEEKLIELYSASDVFVFPNYPQTWGLAVFEAMGCGTPVIVSTGCGASEVLADGENALLVPPKSPEKIVGVIITLKDNHELWKKLSVNGRRFVEENIRWDLYAKNMMKVFNEVLEEKMITRHKIYEAV